MTKVKQADGVTVKDIMESLQKVDQNLKFVVFPEGSEYPADFSLQHLENKKSGGQAVGLVIHQNGVPKLIGHENNETEAGDD